MRTLTASALAEAQASAAEPVLVLKLELDSGTKYYASRELATPVAAPGRIVSVSPLDLTIDEEKCGGAGDCTVILADPELELRGLLETEEFAGKAITLYQHFDGLGESDLAPLAGGVVGDDLVWREQGRELELRIAELAVTLRNRQWGRYATRDEFPKLPPEEEGTMLPLVFGAPKRVRAVLVKGGAKTTLAVAATAGDTELIVADAREFPTGEVNLRVGQEEIAGEFEGNRFLVSERGRVIETGQTTHVTGGSNYVRDANLSGEVDNAYAGLFIRATVAGKEQRRRIVASAAETGTLTLHYGFNGISGQPVTLEAGVEFEIVTLALAHRAGEEVREALAEYVYLVSDAPATAVDAVEGYGTIETEVVSDGLTVAKRREGYITLPSQYYKVTVDDTETFPDLGRAVATVKVSRLPTHLPELDFSTDELWVSARGYPLSAGTEMDNPADIIKYLLTEVAGVAESRLDETSFAAAKAARAEVKMAFSLAKPRPVGEVLAELAFQGRLCLCWEGGAAKLRALSNALDATSALTLEAEALEFESAELGGATVGGEVTELTAKYTHRGEQAAVTVSDPVAAAARGSKSRSVSFWAFAERRYVARAAEWWLRRWAYPRRRLEVTTFLPGLPAERHDTVTVDYPLLFATPARGRVAAVRHEAGRYAEGRIDRVTLALDLPTWAGCASSCEHSCETTACEAEACELSCTAGCETGCEWACEASCEETCQLICTTACQLSCQATCQASCRAAAQAADTSCASACETGCETACESQACETGCESCCEVSCESADTETISPVRQVKVVTGPATQYGSLQVTECDKDGNAACPAFTAYDPFDVAPGAGETATVFLNFNYQWVVVPNRREAKYVKVLSSAGGDLYSVIEQDAEGNQWGAAFYAWAVDSV